MKINFIKVLSLGVLLISFFLFFFQLGKNSLIEFDEGIYALVAKRMIESGEFLNLQWQKGIPWFDKGPLYFWLTSPLLKILGETSLAVRFWSALLGFLTVFCVFLIGRILISDLAALVSASVLSTTIGFLYYARLGMLDVPNTFFNTASILLLVSSKKRTSHLYFFAVIIALGFLNRGLLALLGPASFLIYASIFERGYFKPKKEWALSFVIFLLIGAPWHLVMYQRYGVNFLNTYFSHQMFSRFFNVIEGKGAPTFWYLTVVRTHFRIWLIPLVLGLPLLTYKFFKREKPVLLISFWLALTFTIFTASQSKLIWYIMPVYPPLALIVGYVFDWFIKRLRGTLYYAAALSVVLLGPFYVTVLWGRVVTNDFNNDLIAVVEKGNTVPGARRLILADFPYSVSSFYSRFDVRAVPIEELSGLISDKDLGIISEDDVLRISKEVSFKEIYRSGNILLIKKDTNGK